MPFEVGDYVHHGGDFWGQAGAGDEVRSEPFLKIFGLADIQDVSSLIKETINTWEARNAF